MSTRALAWSAAAGLFALFVLFSVVFWAGTNVGTDTSAGEWARVAGVVGGPLVLPLAVLGVALALALLGRGAAAQFLLATVAGAGLLMYAARVVLQALGADDDGGSLSDYPSGHVSALSAAATAAIAIVWAETERRGVRVAAIVAGVVIVLGMSLARVDVGAHSTIDVAGGIVLGVGWAMVCIAVVPPSGVRRPTRTAALGTALCLGIVGFVLIAALYDVEPLAKLDAETAERIAAEVPVWVEALARPFSWLGGWIGMTMLGVAMAAVLARERNWVDLAFLGLALAGSTLVVGILKEWFDRPRPDAGSPIPLPESAAFPSGHAVSGVAGIGALAVLATERLSSHRARVRLWAGAVLLGLGIGLSRIVLNVHYVTDVLAGWCFGLAWLAACLLVRERLRASG